MPERSLSDSTKTSKTFNPESPGSNEPASIPHRPEPGDSGVPASGSVLAFDFGQKRIGVAIGTVLDAGRPGTARALTTIASEANDARFAAIADLIAEWQPLRLLVGHPRNEDGSAHEMTARCERFANQLRGRFRLPVEEVDERFSSVEADARLRGQGLSWQARKEQLDAEAACIILQSWFELLTARRTTSHANAHLSA